ncbi:endolytic transglycosylase MltG [Silvibacterium sp.]|uniref:endolytic transglycosylase MltG n=1 Tax=Silvibacterium sp. TaxID=1964179 RepID=UPI0039E24BAC
MKRLFFLLVLLLIAVSGWLIFAIEVPAGPTSETFVEIAPGTPSMQIAQELAAQGVIRDRFAFELLHLKDGGTLKAGEYRFDHPVAMDEVLDRIRRGDVYTISVTIPEGANLFDIANRVEAAHLGTKDAFLAAARANVQLIADIDPGATSLEGYLFPETYRFARNTSAEKMLTAMVRQFRLTAATLGLSGNDRRVVTMASLVERETPIPAERPLVASVFENRLAKGMPLETDPSVIYAALLEGRYRGTIYASDLAADSAYNTYKHTGLTPGPICNPGAVSLKAAMHPAQTDYLYFVAASANPSGVSKFAKTLEEHEKNVQAYRKSVREAGSR